MDREAQIAAQVAKNIPNSGPEKPPAIVQDALKSPSETLVKPTDYDNDVAALRLLDVFEVPMDQRRDRELLDKLNYIYAWAAEKNKSDDSVDVMTYLRDLEGRLGTSLRGDRIDSLYRWIKLDNERRRIEKEQTLWQR